MISRLESSLLMLATALAGGSGLVLHIMKEWMVPADPFAVVHHPWQPFVLKLHVLSAPFLVLVLGVTVASHAVNRLTKGRRRGRRSGVGVLGTIVPMILSGVLIQVLTGPTALRAAVWTHLVTGLVYLTAYVTHQIVTPPIQRTAEAPRSSYPQGFATTAARSQGSPPEGSPALRAQERRSRYVAVRKGQRERSSHPPDHLQR